MALSTLTRKVMEYSAASPLNELSTANPAGSRILMYDGLVPSRAGNSAVDSREEGAWVPAALSQSDTSSCTEPCANSARLSSEKV